MDVPKKLSSNYDPTTGKYLVLYDDGSIKKLTSQQHLKLQFEERNAKEACYAKFLAVLPADLARLWESDCRTHGLELSKFSLVTFLQLRFGLYDGGYSNEPHADVTIHLAQLQRLITERLTEERELDVVTKQQAEVALREKRAGELVEYFAEEDYDAAVNETDVKLAANKLGWLDLDGIKLLVAEVNHQLGLVRPNWSKFRLTRDTRDQMKRCADYTCRDCKTRMVSAMLQVHHIVPLYKGGTNDAANLAVLCVPCHVVYHRVRI